MKTNGLERLWFLSPLALSLRVAIGELFINVPLFNFRLINLELVKIYNKLILLSWRKSNMNNGIKLSVVTDSQIVGFDFNFANYLFPVSKIKKYCEVVRAQEVRSFDNIKGEKLLNDNYNRFAGKLNKTTSPIGQDMKRELLKKLEDISFRNASRDFERGSWGGQAKPPVSNSFKYSKVGINPVVELNPRNAKRAAAASVVGLILQDGMEKVLFFTAKSVISALINKIRKDKKDISSALIVLSVSYLKVSADYGRAPKIVGAYLEKTMPKGEYFGFISAVAEFSREFCLPQFSVEKSHVSLLNNDELNSQGIYENALLFIRAEW